MEDPAVDEFARHHVIVTELLERLKSVRDDPDAFGFACAELRKHLAKLEEIGPSA